MKNIHKKQIITEISIIVIALLVIFMLTGIVYAYNVFTASEISDHAAANDSTFWDGYQVDDRITDYSGSNSKTQWICLADKRVTGVSGYNRIMCIIDINRDEKGKYSTSIYNQEGVSNQDNDFNAKKLAYLAYAATVDPGTGLIGSRLHGPRDAFYYYYTTTDLQYLIGNFSLKKNDGDAYLDTAASSGATVLAYADEYANSEVVGSSARITYGNDSNASVVVAQDPYGISYSYIGPFNMYAEGGTISGVSIQDGYNWPAVVGFSNAIGGDIQGIWGLPMNGNNFYIVTNSALTSLNPSVTINTQGTAGGGIITNPATGEQTTGFIKSRIIFIGSNRGQGTAVFRGDGEVVTETTNDSITFSARNSLGKLTIQKEGVYTGIQNYENVKTLGFKIYRLEGNTRRYMRINNVSEIRDQVTITIDGNTSYSESAENATTIFTSSNGTVTLDNISVEHNYYIEEINTDATNYQTKIISATIQYGYNGESYLNVSNNLAGPIAVQLKGENNVITKVKLTDYRKTGNLSIEKVDEDNSNTKLGNVEFKIRNKDTNRYVIANRISSGSYAITDPLNAYTTNEANGTTFVTNATTGKIVVNGLDVGNYEIIEKKNPNYGYTVLANNVSVSISNGQTAPVTIKNRKQTGNLKIQKVDGDDNNVKLSNVSFKIKNSSGKYIIAKNTSGKTQSSVTGSITLGGIDTTTNVNQATEFKTDTNGNIQINQLLVDTYEIIEMNNPHYGYTVKPSNVKVTLTRKDTTTKVITNQKQTGNLRIQKQDTDNSGRKMAGVRFRIRRTTSNTALGSGYVVGMQNNQKISTATGTVYFDNMTVTSNAQQATTFVTDTEGLAQIYNMLIGTYVVEEISIGDNFGYEIDSNFISWTVTNSNGTTSNVNKSTSATIEVVRQKSTNTTQSAAQQKNGNVSQIIAKNQRKYIKISGYAWEDREQDKTSKKDNLWNANTEDKRLQYVTVRLKKADGTTLATTVTNANGEYVFGNYDENPNAVKIRIDDLTGAYVEFEYNGMSYQTIAIRSENNGNKATDSALRSDMNNRFATIVKDASQNTNGQNTHTIRYNRANYTSTVIYGDSVNRGYEGQTYPISGVDDQYVIQAITTRQDNNILCTTDTADSIRKNGTEEITNINLGVEEREMPDLNVAAQDIENVQIKFNDYTHTYKYGQVSADTSASGFAGGDVSNIGVRFASKYIASSYTRAIYTSDVVYNNQPGNDGSLQVYVNYSIRLVNEATTLNSTIKTIANYYDARYENIVVTDENGNNLNYTINQNYNSNGLKRMDIQVNKQMQAQTDEYIYITYQLNNDAINDLLNQKATLNSITEITSYSTYTSNNFSSPYAGIDVDSAPDNATPGDTTTYEDDTNWAPSLILELKEGRMIEGTVWEDSAVDTLLAGTGLDKQRKGDGKYDAARENVVNNVKVELLTYDDSTNTVGSVAQLYKKDNSVVNAETTTGPDDEGINGSYSFSGVIPGKYVIRYTYGDTSVICDTSGNVIKNVVADDYKSTIYRDGNQSAADAMTDFWYRGETSHEGALRLSDAKDDEQFITQRITNEEINYGTVVSGPQFTEIFADTRQFEIKLDYDVNLDNTSGYGIDLKFVFDNIDFGIIERPKQSVIVDKQVANVNIQLANGSTLISGDPRTENLSYVRLLPDGSLHIEVDNEIIQGATLTLTYEISVDNSNSEIDYNDENYYIYGTVPDGNANYTIASVVDMYDYLPEDVMLQSTDGDWETKEITSDLSGTYLAEKVYDIVKGFQNVVHLKQPNSIFANMPPNSKKSTTLTVSRQLSVSNDDLTYENDVEIIELEGRRSINIETGEYDTPGNYDPTTNQSYDPDTDTFVGDEQDDDYVEVIITGPTGENRQYIIYGILGISMLILVGAGIVVIKKFVIKK